MDKVALPTVWRHSMRAVENRRSPQILEAPAYETVLNLEVDS